MEFTLKNNKIYFSREGEVGVISACHEGAIRFQASASLKIVEENHTLLPVDTPAQTWTDNGSAYLKTGKLTVRIENNGRLSYMSGDRLLLKEQPLHTFSMGYRNYRSIGSNLWKMYISFEPNAEEEFYGLGHERLNAFSKKGCTIDLHHENAKSSIPYYYSSLGYGFLWNMPSTGRVDLSENRTRWYSDCAKQMDFIIIEGTPFEASSTLADLSGHAPEIPEWALGFWQSRLRYETQDQLLEVARHYKEMGVPLSVIVVDYFHWTEQGDYKFDSKYWPDPKAMADELHEMGVKLMVSMWPTINENSENYRYMLDHNMLLRTASGSNRVFDFYGPQAEIDPSNPEAREYVFKKLKENYLDNGVDLLWFDEAEPEIHPEHFDNIIMYDGRGDEIALKYPYYYSQLVYDGLKEMGRSDIITLSRAAYLGSQKFGTLVWSGDIHSSFESLREQIKSGLNMSMCGIPWWNTDIGGFYGGDIRTDYFKELMIRWFQYGLFCPVMRLHGTREGIERRRDLKEPSGAGNEIWCFGDNNTDYLASLIKLRYKLIPYIKKNMHTASEYGTPIMRPMFFDYPEDKTCYKTGDQYMFGNDILFAPIYEEGSVSRKVYLPKGRWILTRDKTLHEGENWYTIDAGLHEFIAFVKENADVINVF